MAVALLLDEDFFAVDVAFDDAADLVFVDVLDLVFVDVVDLVFFGVADLAFADAVDLALDLDRAVLGLLSVVFSVTCS